MYKIAALTEEHSIEFNYVFSDLLSPVFVVDFGGLYGYINLTVSSSPYLTSPQVNLIPAQEVLFLAYIASGWSLVIRVYGRLRTDCIVLTGPRRHGKCRNDLCMLV